MFTCFKQLQLGQKKMIIDVPTPWNSIFFLLKVALTFKDAFPMYKERDPNYDCMPELEEWDKVEKVCKMLEVLMRQLILFQVVNILHLICTLVRFIGLKKC